MIIYIRSIIIFVILLKIHDCAKFDTYTKSIKCYDINEKYIKNHTCRLFAKRGTQGLIFAYFDINKIEYLTVNFLVYQRSSITYRPWAVHITIDLCEALKDLNYHGWQNPAVKMIMSAGNILLPRIMDGCPYKGTYETKKIDLNATLYPLLPPVWPTGQFKITFDAKDTKSNETIGRAELELVHKQAMAYRAMNFNF